MAEQAYLCTLFIYAHCKPEEHSVEQYRVVTLARHATTAAPVKFASHFSYVH